MAVRPEEFLTLNAKDEVDCIQAERLIDAMFRKQRGLKHTVRLKISKDGAMCLCLVKENRPYFMLISGSVLEALVIRYKKAGWDIWNRIDKSDRDHLCFQEGVGVGYPVREASLMFDVRLRLWDLDISNVVADQAEEKDKP